MDKEQEPIGGILGQANEPLQDTDLQKYKAYVQTSQQRPVVGPVFMGIVVDNVDPDEYGRVKVIINALTPDKTSAESAKWAVTSNVFGGGQRDNNQKRYGAVFPYPIGCKVYCLFQETDKNYAKPIVMGGFYQNEKIPPQVFDRTKPGKHIPRAWGYVSPKGHWILCREEDKEECIELVSHKGRKIIISDKVDQELISCIGVKGGEIELFEGKEGTILTFTDPSGDVITIDEKKATITVQARLKIELVCGGQINATAAESITLSSPMINLLGPVNPYHPAI